MPARMLATTPRVYVDACDIGASFCGARVFKNTARARTPIAVTTKAEAAGNSGTPVAVGAPVAIGVPFSAETGISPQI